MPYPTTLLALFTLGLVSRVAAVELFSFQAGPTNSRWPLGTIAVGNIDDDPELEIVIPIHEAGWRIEAYDINGVMKPGFPNHTGTGPAGQNVANLSPTLVNLDADARLEILFVAGNNIIARNGEDNSHLWTRTIDHTNYVPDSGYQSTVGGFNWSNGGAFIPNLPASARFYHEVSPLMVADVEGDGSREVVTAWKIDPDSTSSSQDFNPVINNIFGFGEWGTVGEAWSGGVVFLDAGTGAKEYVYHIHQLIEAGLTLGQADADAGLETYVLNDSDSIVAFDKTQPHGFHGKGTLHKKFGKNQRLISGTYGIGVDVFTTDIDGDGLAEVLVPSRETEPLWEPQETILDDDGAVMWRHWKPILNLAHDGSWGWMNSSCMIPVNPDHDNRIDVITFANSQQIYFREWDGRQLVDRPGWPKNFAPMFPTPPVVGDVDGDGQEELVIGTYDPVNVTAQGNLYVCSLDGTVEQNVSLPAGLKHIPSLVDVDNNGTLDVVFRTSNGRVYAHNFGPGNPNAVSWASHCGNAQRDRNFARDLFPPGTPRVPSKQGQYKRSHFSWQLPVDYVANEFRIYRANSGAGPFDLLRILPGTATSFTDDHLTNGQPYLYEVGALYGSSEVRSPTFVVVPDLNGNRLFNGGMETDDDDRWDKWYTNFLLYEDIRGVASPTHSGNQAAKVSYLNYPSETGSIRQANQYGVPDPTIFTTPGQLYSFGGYLKSDGFFSPNEHWFEWESTKTGLDYNNRPLRPYPNYFTPHLIADGAATGWRYANRVFILPSGFPNVDVRHRMEAPESGSVTGQVYLDDLFFRELPPLTNPSWLNWISFGSTWRYFASVSNPPAAWFQRNFDDSSWPQAPAKFGEGATQNVATFISPINQPKYYFRKTFVPPTGQHEELLLVARCTDNANDITYPLEVWLNGQPLVTTGIEAVTGLGNEDRYFDLTPYLHLIEPGVPNTIAVILNNTWNEFWDVIAFDINLKAMPYTISGYSGWAGNVFAATAGGPSALMAQALSDADSDSVLNLLERAVNSPALMATEDNLPTSSVANISGQDYPAIRYRRWKNGTQLTNSRYQFDDMLYVLEVSDSLASNSWTDAAILIRTGLAQDHGDGTETVEWRFPDPLTSSVVRKFARLKVLLTQ